MKTKVIVIAVLLLAVGMAKAQITPSMTIPNPLPNYDGSYDDFGTNHLFYPNDGEVRYADADQDDALDQVKFYTMNTYPKKFLLRNNNISFVHFKPKTNSTGSDSLQRIDLKWTGSKSGAFLARVDTQNFAQLNYLTQWFASGRTNVKGGAAIACQSIYQNIDLVYTSNNAGLVMYFIVYPGGNFNSIRMHIDGSKANSIISGSGKLKVDANWEGTTFEKPNMYQYSISSGNVITPVNVGTADWQNIATDMYKISSSSAYNSSLPLIIQIKQASPLAINTPGLLWSTYFGGNQFEFLTKTHADSNNNLYIAGYSNSANNFPQAPGVAQFVNNNGDATIARFDSQGVLIFTTFAGGSSRDEFYDFAFNGDNVYCVGRTDSPDINAIAKNGATNDGTFSGPGWDGLILQFSFNTSNNIFTAKWLTYYGGNGDEELNGCVFDAAGNFYIVGASASTDMSLVNPGGGAYQQNYNTLQSGSSLLSTDGIIAKFNTASAQTWFTFYGTHLLGANAHSYAADYFYGIDISGNNIYVCGKVGGTNLPSNINNKFVNGDFDGILVHFTTAGVLNTAKFTEGNNANYAVNEFWGEVYTVGEVSNSMNTTNSSQYPFQGSLAGTKDACFSVHSQNLQTTIHNSFLGGSSEDAAYDIQVVNNLFLIGGGTNSNNFPANNSLSNMFFSSAAGVNDNFVFCMQKGNPTSIWSTNLGSNFQESLQFPGGINFQFDRAITTLAVDNLNQVYLLSTSNSFNTFPLNDGGGFPVFFQGNSGGLANSATVTRFDVADLLTVVGMKDFEHTELGFGLYPNPTAKNISITNTALTNDNLRYAIYDMSGKKLNEGNWKAGDAKSVDVSALPQGVYIINVSNGKKTFSDKFVKAEN